MRIALRFGLAVVLASALTQAHVLHAEQYYLASNADQNTTHLQSGIEPAGLMIDASVVRQQHERRIHNASVRYDAVQAKKVNPSRTIAIVPFDYKDQYNVGAFDARRGDLDCNMNGVYAQCVYTRSSH